MNFINIGIYVLAWFLSFTIGSILAFPIEIILVSITKLFPYRYRLLYRLESFLGGRLIGTITIIGTHYFLKIFDLQINWWLLIFIIMGFIFNGLRRIVISTNNKELLYDEIFDLIGITGAILAISILYK